MQMRIEKFFKWLKVVSAILLVLGAIALSVILIIVCEPKKEEPKRTFPERVKAKEVSIDYTEEDVKLLSRLIFAEAEDEPYKGQVAVGAVVINRMQSKEFPSTMEEVIFQNRQFSCIDDGRFYLDIPENSSVYDAAREALEGKDPSKGSLYFYDPRITTNKWMLNETTTVVTIGNHRFAVEK